MHNNAGVICVLFLTTQLIVVCCLSLQEKVRHFAKRLRQEWECTVHEKELVFDSMFTFQPVRFRGSSLMTPLPYAPPLPLPPPPPTPHLISLSLYLSFFLSLSHQMYIPISDEAVWRNDELFLVLLIGYKIGHLFIRPKRENGLLQRTQPAVF